MAHTLIGTCSAWLALRESDCPWDFPGTCIYALLGLLCGIIGPFPGTGDVGGCGGRGYCPGGWMAGKFLLLRFAVYVGPPGYERAPP